MYVCCRYFCDEPGPHMPGSIEGWELGRFLFDPQPRARQFFSEAWLYHYRN